MDSDQVIQELLANQNIHQEDNVIELYLGKQGLEEVNSLQRFRMLQRIWLNSNKLRDLFMKNTQQSFLQHNFRVSELHLQCNELSTITGAISHLRCLQVLMLQKNQLANLSAVLQELLPLRALKTLNLFDNPMAQEEVYRLLTIHLLPSVNLLDRQGSTDDRNVSNASYERSNTGRWQALLVFWKFRREVKATERKAAYETYEPHQQAVKDSVAFGRALSQASYENDAKQTRVNTADLPKTPTNFVDKIIKKTDPNDRRSLMQYTMFDWSRVPDSLQRRQGTPVLPPKNLTVTFR